MVGLSLYAIIDQGRRPERQVLYLLDEFGFLGHMPPVEMAAGLAAGFGGQLWPIFQDMSQVEYLYPGMWRTFFANAAVIQAFGVNDTRAAEELSKRLGPQTIKSRSHSESQTQDKATVGETMGETGRPLLMPDEILRLPKHQQLVLLQGCKPILAEKIDYRTDDRFSSRGQANPMYAKSP
jgi:type IV secretion system protein VirD4